MKYKNYSEIMNEIEERLKPFGDILYKEGGLVLGHFFYENEEFIFTADIKKEWVQLAINLPFTIDTANADHRQLLNELEKDAYRYGLFDIAVIHGTAGLILIEEFTFDDEEFDEDYFSTYFAFFNAVAKQAFDRYARLCT